MNTPWPFNVWPRKSVFIRYYLLPYNPDPTWRSTYTLFHTLCFFMVRIIDSVNWSCIICWLQHTAFGNHSLNQDSRSRKWDTDSENEAQRNNGKADNEWTDILSWHLQKGKVNARRIPSISAFYPPLTSSQSSNEKWDEVFFVGYSVFLFGTGCYLEEENYYLGSSILYPSKQDQREVSHEASFVGQVTKNRVTRTWPTWSLWLTS